MCFITAYGLQCLVAGCQGLGAGQPAALHPTPYNLQTIGGNNTHSLELLMMGIELSETC